MTTSVFGSAGELHGLFVATIAIPVAIMIVAITVKVMVAVAISIAIPVVISVSIAVVIGVMAMETVAVTIAISRAVHLTRIHDEICAAAVIDPHTLLIESPASSLNAR
jgi:hypothetical protein